ncbi:MAG: hypothetical protein ACYDDE_07325, partial [bacterium]
IGKALEKSLKEIADLKKCNCGENGLNADIIKKNNNNNNCNSKYKDNDHENNLTQFRGACPSCGGSNLKHAEGCTVCLDCGYSDCG